MTRNTEVNSDGEKTSEVERFRDNAVHPKMKSRSYQILVLLLDCTPIDFNIFLRIT